MLQNTSNTSDNFTLIKFNGFDNEREYFAYIGINMHDHNAKDYSFLNIDVDELQNLLKELNGKLIHTGYGSGSWGDKFIAESRFNDDVRKLYLVSQLTTPHL